MHIQAHHTPAFRRGYRLQWEAAQDCHVILYPEGMAKLNDSATAILSEVDGIKSVGEIIATLEARFPDAEELAADVLDFLAQAYAQKWVIFRE